MHRTISHILKQQRWVHKPLWQFISALYTDGGNEWGCGQVGIYWKQHAGMLASFRGLSTHVNKSHCLHLVNNFKRTRHLCKGRTKSRSPLISSCLNIQMLTFANTRTRPGGQHCLMLFLLCALCYDTVNSNRWLTDKWMMNRKGFRWSVHGLTQVISWHLRNRLMKATRKLQSK
jgi:hypothetical protein